MAERGAVVGEAQEVPVEPHPVEAERVRDGDRASAVGGLPYPGERGVHRLARLAALAGEAVAVETGDLQGRGVDLFADRLQLRVERTGRRVARREGPAVERAAGRQAEAEHGVR